jgi:ethanolamine utilization protein EutP (predicted NTPase)
VGSAPTLQNCLKKMGKKPAITVVAKAELAQSYKAQLRMAFLSDGCMVLGEKGLVQAPPR